MNRRRNRPAFTLVEMLVATALIMFVMLILSEAFVQGLDAFRVLKGIGDLEKELRAATITLRNDLLPDHFEGRRRLSDPAFTIQGVAYPGVAGVYHPREGFFSIIQGATPTFSPNGVGAGLQTVTVPSTRVFNPNSGMYWDILPGAALLIDAGVPGAQETVLVSQVTPNQFQALFQNGHGPGFSIRLIRYMEGTDADGLPSSRAVDHQLNFTVKLRGNRREDFFSASVPSSFLSASTNFFGQAGDARFQDSGEYSSQWAEIAYFLVPTGTTANGTTLYSLYRSQFVLVPDSSQVNGQVTLPGPLPDLQQSFAELSCQKASGNYQFWGAPPQPQVEYLNFNNPSDVAMPAATLTYGNVINPTTVAVQALSGQNASGSTSWQIQPGYILVVDAGTPSVETVLVTGVNAAGVPPTFTVSQPLANNHNANFPIQTVRRAFLAANGTGSFTGSLIGSQTGGLGPPLPLLQPAWPGGTRGIPNGIPGFNGASFTPYLPGLWGASLVLTDVVSFDVQVFPQGGGDFADLSAISSGTYDTGGAPQIQAFPIKALQITLRVWNFRTQQTRQITMIQDM